MSFDSVETCETTPAFIVWRGKQHKLLITQRNIPEAPLSAEQWQALVEATIGLWLRVVTLNSMALEAIAKGEIPTWVMDTTAPHKKVLQADGVTPLARTISPHVTVCNFDYDNPTFTVVSNESAESSVVMMHGMIMALHNMREKKPDMFEGVTPPYRAGNNSTAQTTMPDNDKGMQHGTPASTRIGQHADTLPDTGAIAETSGLRPAMIAPLGSVGDIMFASGKNDTSWQFALWATKKIDYQNKSGLQYGNGEIRAYPLKSVEIKEVKGSKDFPAAIVASIKTQLGNIDIWKKKKDSDENTYDWIALSDAMAQIGILSPQLVVGFKKSIDAIALIKIAHSEDGTKEYKNLYGFRAMPTGAQAADRPHDDLNTYFGTPDETNEYTRQNGIPF